MDESCYLVIFSNFTSIYWEKNKDVVYYSDDVRDIINTENIGNGIYPLFKRLKRTSGSFYQYVQKSSPTLLKRALNEGIHEVFNKTK